MGQGSITVTGLAPFPFFAVGRTLLTERMEFWR